MFRIFISKLRRDSREHRKDLPDIYVDTMFYYEDKPLSAIVANAANKPGVLAEITRTISEKGINILKVNVLDIPRGDRGFILLLLENCNEKCVEEVIKSLKSNAMLKDKLFSINYSTAENGFVFLKYNSVLFDDSTSFILLHQLLESAVYEVIKDNLMGASLFLTSFGKGIGRAIYDRFIKDIEELPGDTIEEKVSVALDLFCNLYKAMGLGEMGIEEKGTGRYIVSIKNNFECMALKKYGTGKGYPARTGFITRGIIAGFYEKLFNRIVEVYEEACVLEGRDADVFTVRIRESIFSRY